MVAAWMRADTGVGPAIASGSQVSNGICADLPVQPKKIRIAASDRTPTEAAICAVLAVSRNHALIWT